MVGIAAALGALAIYALISAAEHWRVLPMYDHWGQVDFYRRWLATGPIGPIPHNEHWIVLTRFWFLIDLHFFRGTNAFVYAVLILSPMALAFMLARLATFEDTIEIKLLFLAAFAALFLSPIQSDNLILPFHSTIAQVCLFAAAALYAVARLTQTPGSYGFLLAACVATPLAVFTMANGLVAAALVAMTAAVLRLPLWPRVLLLIFSVGPIALYISLYQPVPYHEGFRPNLVSGEGLRKVAEHSLGLMGAVAQYWRLEGAIIFGGIGAAILALFAWLTLSAIKDRRVADPRTLALLLIACFAAGTALMVSLGRGGTSDPEHQLASRYATFSILFWASIAALGWRLAGVAAWAPATSRAMALAALLLITIFTYLPSRRMADAADRTVAIDALTRELRAGQMPPVLPNPHNVYYEPHLIPFMREKRLSIFAFE